MKLVQKLWPLFLILAMGCALAGCTVTMDPEGYADVQVAQPIEDLADSVGVPIEDIGGVVVDVSDEAVEVVSDAVTGNYVGLFSSVGALIAALVGSIVYRKKRAKKSV